MEFCNEEPCSSTQGGNQKTLMTCSIPSCTSQQFRNNSKTGIGFFTFIPTDVKIQNNWKKIINLCRRKWVATISTLKRLVSANITSNQKKLRSRGDEVLNRLQKMLFRPRHTYTRKAPKVRHIECPQSEDGGEEDGEPSNEIVEVDDIVADETDDGNETKNERTNVDCLKCVENTLTIITLKCESPAWRN